MIDDMDTEALGGVRAWAQRRVDRAERQRRMAPIYDAVGQRGEMLASSVIPDLMAEPIANSRRSLLNLERSVAEWPERKVEQEARFEAELARVRRRTAALRAWLEALS